jgi:DNA-binding MarR family transcriptional regulator
MQVPADSGSTARSKSVESVMHALMSIGRLLRQRSSSETLEPASFWMLKTIDANGSIRVTDLATCVNLDASTVSRHVAQLDRAGLIERTPDPFDRRAQRVKLSSIGEGQLEAAIRARRALLERGLEGWAADDLEQLDRLLNRFVVDVEGLSKGGEDK